MSPGQTSIGDAGPAAFDRATGVAKLSQPRTDRTATACAAQAATAPARDAAPDQAAHHVPAPNPCGQDSNSPLPCPRCTDPVLESGADNSIVIHGAREHNLKNISLRIPRDRLVVVTGVSGSGKSTLAFDLLFAEGQRRFLDSMNTYARQFVEQLTRPDVDLITGIPPTVSIEQRTRGGGGKSTVATVTEIYHFLRLLFARLGLQYCPQCQLPVQAQTRDQLVRQLQTELRKRGDLLLLAPVVKRRKGFHTDVAEWAAKHGYKEIRADGKIYDTSKPFRLDRYREHNIEIVVGVLEKKGAPDARAASRRTHVVAYPHDAPGTTRRTPEQLIDEALKLGHGTLFALDNYGQLTVHSTERSCPRCGTSFEPLDPKNFSFNSPAGWCPRCRGFGELFWMPEDVDRGARAEMIEETWFEWMEGEREPCPECGGSRLNPVARAVRLIFQARSARRIELLDPTAPFSTTPGAFPLERLADPPRGKPFGITVVDFAAMSVEAADAFFARLSPEGRAELIARDILPEIRERLRFLMQVGLGYLQLGRAVPTLSGGESQRIRLAAQLGSNLSGVLYILDEPTIGLHPRDNERLLDALAQLKARGNSVVVVEHDEATMRRADYIIDLGPGAGVHGGTVVAAGTLQELMQHPESVTGQWLRMRRSYPSRGRRRPVVREKSEIRSMESETSQRREIGNGKSKIESHGWLTLHNACKHNLKNVTVSFPLGRLVLVTGVSGSGKSTLVRECLLPALTAALNAKRAHSASMPQLEDSTAPYVTGYETIRAVHEVDQSPIGRTPRSVPATYVGFFDDIRRLFAQVPEARLRGYGPGRFSFNSPEGRCQECQGAGVVKLEMNFLPTAFVRCESCNGLRFTPETLDIRYRGKNIAEVLDMSVEEALEFFAHVPRIKRALQALADTGLGYLKLGQPSPTLSGGEAQRVKLVTHLLGGLSEPDLFQPRAKRDLFILEEPTIGLHMADVRKLVEVLHRLVDAGHTVIVIEHNLDMIAEADWIIDLGPEGGADGGRVVAQGTPEQVARKKDSHTGRFLRSLLLNT
ncbi:MAG: excinuclease ABC subunit UvrA [Verrucomicrobiales bacterium]|nr:excinuclease ABC subunit UvrA [Verrucomicrobiales bacterium]